jgi:hypothetical protein
VSSVSLNWVTSLPLPARIGRCHMHFVLPRGRLILMDVFD